MLKVIRGGSFGRILDFKSKDDFKNERRKCRVCGNIFVAMNRHAESCDFCKSCFHGVLSAAQRAPALMLV